MITSFGGGIELLCTLTFMYFPSNERKIKGNKKTDLMSADHNFLHKQA